MPVDLSALVQETGDRWFRFAEGLAGVDVLEEDDEDDHLFRLKMKFLSQRQLRKMAGEGVSKRAIAKGGGKALISSDDKYRERVVLEVLEDWELTVEGAYALDAECNFGDLAPDTPIEFTQKNVKTLIEHSQLSAVVQSTLSDHENWFTLERETSVKNSGSGPVSITDGSPADSASTEP